MGDAGEGLVDAQDRADQRSAERERKRPGDRDKPARDPVRERMIRSLQLARVELQHQAAQTSNPRRAEQIRLALEDINRRLADM